MAAPADRLPVQLVHVETRDRVRLDGIAVEPARRRSVALIWLHGLGSTFSSGQPLIRELSARLPAAGIGYFKLNTRGHGVVARHGPRLAGAAFERFEHCVADIHAIIALARERGYARVVLAGHSTGANKALHYAARAGDRRVAAIALLGPVSDVAAEAKRIGAAVLRRRVAAAERIARRDPDGLVPRGWGFWGARRYVSLYKPGQAEDVFPYYRPGARWSALQSVRAPIAAIIGGRDEYLDREPGELIDAFREHATRTRRFTGIVVAGATHGFQGHEKPLATALVEWLRSLSL